jgi:ribonuclease HI
LFARRLTTGKFAACQFRFFLSRADNRPMKNSTALVFSDATPSAKGAGTGGAGYLIRTGDVLRFGGVRFSTATPGGAEIHAAAIAVERLAAMPGAFDSAILHSDRTEVVGLVNGMFGAGRSRSSERVVEAAGSRGIRLAARWVKGHDASGSADAFANACCDFFARFAKLRGDFEKEMGVILIWHSRCVPFLDLWAV